MYRWNIYDSLFHNCINTVMLELLIMGSGLGIPCHSIINHFHNFTITVNMCTLTENAALYKLELGLSPFRSCYLIEHFPRSPLRVYYQCMFMYDITEWYERGPWRPFNQVMAHKWGMPKLKFGLGWILCKCTHIHSNNKNYVKDWLWSGKTFLIHCT